MQGGHESQAEEEPPGEEYAAQGDLVIADDGCTADSHSRRECGENGHSDEWCREPTDWCAGIVLLGAPTGAGRVVAAPDDPGFPQSCDS